MDSKMARSTGLNPVYIAIACFLSLGGITFGLDCGALAGFLAMPSFQRDFGTYDPHLGAMAISANRQLLFNLPSLAFAVVCSLASGEIASRFGRRGGYVALGLTSGVGAALQLGATNVTTLIAGKVIVGGVYGLGSAMVPMYISETAPAVVRGMLVSLLQMSINTGQLLVTAINWGTHNLESRWAYRGPFMAEMLVPAIILIGIWFVPESPRWLLLKGRKAPAIAAFRTFRGRDYPEVMIQEEVEAIAHAIEEEKRVATSNVSWAALFQGSNRRRTAICCLLYVCQQYSGISFLTSYGTYFFVLCGIQNSFMISFVLNVMGVGGSVASIFLLKFFGRRPIMLIGGVMQCISMLTFAIVGVAAPGSQAAARCLAGFTLLYEFCFSASWGPLTYVLASEIASTELRAKTLALATAINWTCTLSLAAWLPYALNPTIGNLGPKLGFIFGPFIAIGTVWMYFYLPETSDRTLEQLDELFIRGVPARKSASYRYGSDVSSADAKDEEEKVMDEQHNSIASL